MDKVKTAWDVFYLFIKTINEIVLDNLDYMENGDDIFFSLEIWYYLAHLLLKCYLIGSGLWK